MGLRTDNLSGNNRVGEACMRSRPEIYQANAEACRQQAALRSDPSEKRRCLVLADQWMQMAEAAKKQQRHEKRLKRYIPRVAGLRETIVRPL
jgi:putative SOS response-associated peptidase YedK